MKKILLLLAIIALAVPAWAFRFYPIVMEFAPGGAGASRAFYAENTGDESIGIQISLKTRTMDIDGGELNEDAGDLFLVYPAQMVLAPGRRQAIRVQWLGPTDPDREMAFRIVAEQLPVEFETDRAEGGKINILFRYIGAVYITPRTASHDINVVSAKVESGDEGPYLDITVANAGTAHTILSDLEMAITGRDGTPIFVLKSDALKGMAGENILAASRRQFRIPLTADVVFRGPVNAELTFTPTK